VNGVINKTDGNFLHGWAVSDIANQGLILGPYPIYEIDVDEIVKLRAKAVMNIQTPEEDQARHFNKVPIEKFYKAKGIQQIVDHPVNYEDEQRMYKDLAEGATRLNDLINGRGLKVFLHDTSSITRGPTLAIVYLCMYLRHPDWQNPEAVEKYLKKLHPIGEPNMLAVHNTIEAYKHI
jgi:hypothetical protein